MSRVHAETDVSDAIVAARSLERAVSRGEVRPESTRADRFVEQMLTRPPLSDFEVFEPFVESPFSGSRNPLSPLAITMMRVGDTVRAEVRIGIAMEGAPGRAHGGITAALFDDAMGALQVVIGKAGYTRSLTIEYLAPFPIDQSVTITAHEVPATEGLFAIDASATFDGFEIARSHGVFTEIGKERFARR